MATTVTIDFAAEHLPELLDRAVAGEEIIIAKAGQAVAKLSAVAGQSQSKERVLGGHQGRIWMSPDFDDEDEEILKLFGS